MVDAIVTYVNNSDNKWVSSYIKTTHTHNPSACRFRSWGTLKYLFRGIEKYMPFVQNIILVVASESQIPAWVDATNVRVVLHEEFIPKKFLPTFNSCTIESFFWNIPNLADKVIYFNDDMFPTAPMTEDDFFTDDKPHIKFKTLEVTATANLYRQQCRSGMDMITTALDLPKFDKGKFIRPYHITTAFTKDGLNAIGELCEDLISKSVSVTRTARNVNQYIYAYWHYFTDNYIPQTINYKYFEFTDKTFPEIVDTIGTTEYQMLCLNDTDKIKDYARTRYLLQRCFEEKFPDKSKYEL